MEEGGEQGFDYRWREIGAIWQEYRGLYLLAGFILGLLAFPALQRISENLTGLLSDLVPEAFGIVFTVALIDRIARIRDTERHEHEYREQLIRDAGSTSNETAKNALHQMHKRDWLRGAKRLLAGRNFRAANWRKADLWKANLEKADLSWINLHDAYVYACNMRYANLRYGRLIGTDLRGTNFEGADLSHANMTNAILSGTSVNGVFRTATFNTETILPDGSIWSPEVDMTKFGVILNYRTPPEALDSIRSVRESANEHNH